MQFKYAGWFWGIRGLGRTHTHKHTKRSRQSVRLQQHNELLCFMSVDTKRTTLSSDWRCFSLMCYFLIKLQDGCTLSNSLPAEKLLLAMKPGKTDGKVPPLDRQRLLKVRWPVRFWSLLVWEQSKERAQRERERWSNDKRLEPIWLVFDD